MAEPAARSVDSAPAAAGGRAVWAAVFLPYALGYFFSYLLRNVNAVMAPELSKDLAISAADLGLLTGAYLAAFALAQLPLGMLLDRHGPRRIQVGLLGVAALGCGAFGLGQTLNQLILARAVIGIGVSGCLMAAFKAFSQYFPASRHASLNASIMIAGGLGALTASSPFGFLLPMVGWRWIFAGLCVVALAAAWAVFRMPDKPVAASQHGIREQLAGLGSILGGRHFWRFAPMVATMIGGFIAIQGLWAVPWLTTVAGLDRNAAAFCLLLLNVALMTGYAAIATFIGRVLQRGVTLSQVLVAGGLVALLASLGLVLNLRPGYLLWLLLGLAFSTTNLAYAHHASCYPPSLSGRANTCLNLGVFIGGFSLQWGFGIVVDAAQARGLRPSEAMPLAWGLLLALQLAGLSWFAVGGKRPWRRYAAA